MSGSSDWQASSAKRLAASPSLGENCYLNACLSQTHAQHANPSVWASALCFPGSLGPPALARTPRQPSHPGTSPASTGELSACWRRVPAGGGPGAQTGQEPTHWAMRREKRTTQQTIRARTLSSLSFILLCFGLSFKSYWPSWSFLGIVDQETHWGPCLDMLISINSAQVRSPTALGLIELLA